jgi:hypothetical protein
MGLLYSNLYTLYVHIKSTTFDFFNSCIVITCSTKTTTMLQLGTMNIHAIMPCVHISTTHYGIYFQLVFYYDSN